MLKPMKEPDYVAAEYIASDRLPVLPKGFCWQLRGTPHWMYLCRDGVRKPILWVVCENGRLMSGVMNSDVGYWLSLTEEKEQIMQLLTKWRLINEAT